MNKLTGELSQSSCQPLKPPGGTEMRNWPQRAEWHVKGIISTDIHFTIAFEVGLGGNVWMKLEWQDVAG